MTKITMKNPIAELDGDEMTRIIWHKIKEIIILPRIDLKSEYFDLGLHNRERTEDKVTHEAAEAIKRLKVGVKCATITPNMERMTEYKLTQMWKSPNGTIRASLDGTVFRTPIIAKNLQILVPTWTKPISIARHAYGDIYGGVEAHVVGGGEVTLTYPAGTKTVANLADSGVILAMHNTDKSISGFARSCFNYALSIKQDLWFGAKDTISKIYDHRFKDIFAEIFEKEYKDKFASAGLNYNYSLIDDTVARVMKSNGGMIWACKNYDGDVMSDMVATAFGSLAMMTSVLVSPDGCYEYEAAHGTVTRHYYQHMKGEVTSTNPMATLFAWSGALRKRGELDGTPDLCAFADRLETASLQTIESGIMTGDLTALAIGPHRRASTQTFLEEIAKRL